MGTEKLVLAAFLAYFGIKNIRTAGGQSVY